MSSGNRQAPMPPPKPRNLGRGQFYQGGYLTPQDSDTDSGISADCDQGSPRTAAGFQASGQAPQRRVPDLPPNSYHNIRSQSSTDYLTPNSARKIAGYGTTPRRLPLQPNQQPSTAPPPKAKYRVRFADEVDSGASTSSGTSSTHISPRNDPREMLMNSAVGVPVTTPYQPPAGGYSSQNSADTKSMVGTHEFAPASRMAQSSSSARTGTLQRTPGRRLPFDRTLSSTPQPQPTYVDQMQSLPEPPPYSLAMQRMRSVEQQPQESFRDAYIRKSVNDTLQRRYRQRSSSLPRGNKSYYEGVDDAYSMQPPILMPAQHSSLMTSINQLPGSLDNLHITNLNNMGMRRRKLPTAPLMGSSCQLHLDNSDELTAYRALQFQMMQEELARQPPLPQSFERQPTLLRRTNLPPPPPQQQTLPAYNIQHITPTGPPQMGMPLSVTPMQYEQQQQIDYGTQTVRAQLVALDQRGFRRVLVEKMMPGPFGFYIATGVVAGQRAGIFISRVSLPSLSPMLTVGDEIIYVDEEYVKGRSLEYVQSVIAGKTSVTITLVPAVGQPPIC